MFTRTKAVWNVLFNKATEIDANGSVIRFPHMESKFEAMDKMMTGVVKNRKEEIARLEARKDNLHAEVEEAEKARDRVVKQLLKDISKD
jgi:hypothetical protein